MTSRLLKTVHESVEDLYEIGIVDVQTMRKFDVLCLMPVREYTADEIRSIRLRCKASQAVFAAYLNTSPSTIQKWERGEKQPSGMALRLLNLVEDNGLELFARPRQG